MIQRNTHLITRIQRFCTGDGPGVRTTLFFQGCPLRCAWCHNPETQSACPVLIWTPRSCVGCGGCVSVCPTGARTVQPAGGTDSESNGESAGEASAGVLTYDRTLCTGCGACAAVCPAGACELSARLMTTEEIVRLVLRDSAFYGGQGGVTLSGGEPLMHPGVISLMDALRDAGVSIAVETAGAVPASLMEDAARRADLFLYDLKDTDPDRLRQYCGADLAHILDNLRLCDRATNGKVRLRCILVRTVNTNPAHYRAIAEVWHSLTRFEGVELIPYHAYAGSKAVRIGRPDNGRTDWIPTPEDLAEARETLSAQGVPVI